MFPYELDAVYEQIFHKKMRVPPLVDPPAVEINILPTSPSQRGKNENVISKTEL
jgi:hypothetical protein